MNHKLFSRHSKSESGIASIMVTLVIMIVISLIVLGFAEISRREQRSALDRQLSTEAFYAAESGVDDAINALSTNPGLTKTQCGPFNTPPLNTGPLGNSPTNTSIIDSANGLSYTCLLINSAPSSIDFDDIGVDTSQVVPLQTNAGTISSVTFSWQQSTGSGTSFSCSALGQFPPATGGSAWSCDPGVLRIELVPTTAANLSRSNLLSNDFVAFLQPETSGGSTTYNPANTGTVVGGSCSTANTPHYCNVTVSGLSASSYYLRLVAIYKDATVHITGTTNSGGAVQFVGAQAEIDSTGKAQDELRRIQVRKPLTSAGNIPSFAIQTDNSICKKISVAPGYASNQSTLSECASGSTAPF